MLGIFAKSFMLATAQETQSRSDVPRKDTKTAAAGRR